MLEEKTYTISKLAAIIGGSSDRQAIKRKLDRRHILYSVQGRGSNATFKIEKIPSPLRDTHSYYKREPKSSLHSLQS